ncbi:MAG: alpha/beta hydrolase family protein [Kiritimatiellales bacterium]
MKNGLPIILTVLMSTLAVVFGNEPILLPAPDSSAKIPWNMEALFTAPETFPAEGFSSGDSRIRALFFKGLDYEGKETRVFAWVGFPNTGNSPFPAMVLVHGAGGTAYEDWVKIWVDRGYAAIAVDTASHIPVHPDGSSNGWKLHEWAGPKGWGDFESIDKPVQDQWPYHAVAAVVRAHSLLRSFPDVDGRRVGLTGISWGGYLTCITAGIDHRFAFAAPVYGCGFLGEDSSWLQTRLEAIGRDNARQWLMLWDPSRYVNRVQMPMLFVNGTNDKHYRMDAWQKTYREVPGKVTLACRLRMPHSDFAGRAPEVYASADALFKGGAPLPEITGQGTTKQTAWIEYRSVSPLQKAELNFTMDRGEWPQRLWQSREISVDASAGKISGEFPDGATAWFINLFDSQGLIVSSQMEEARK